MWWPTTGCIGSRDYQWFGIDRTNFFKEIIGYILDTRGYDSVFYMLIGYIMGIFGTVFGKKIKIWPVFAVEILGKE